MLELVPIHAKTKERGFRVPAKALKAFEEYRRNLCVVDYEKDVWTTQAIIESWICSFADSDEYNEMKRQADEIRAQEKAEKEENRQKEIARLEERLRKLKEK